MRKQLAIVLGLASIVLAKPPVPRAGKDLTAVEPSGKKISLASLKGQVVMVQFLHTTCPHCQATARMLTGLQAKLGPRGLKVVGVAFNDEAQGHPEVVRGFIEQNGVGFPVGLATENDVLGYLEIPVMTRFVVPQMVILDRKGTIRAQSEFLGSAELQNEDYLTKLLDGLLKPTETALIGKVGVRTH
jgi:thiol-disulfide isomerase/thioredoxin